MKKLCKWLIPVILLASVFSCKKSTTTQDPTPVTKDTTKPTLTLVDPTADKSFVLGKSMHLQMDLSDDVELKSYKVTIAKSLKGVETADWAYTNTWTIPAGKKTLAVNHSEITVPLTVTGKSTTIGKYDLTVSCLDASGNEASAAIAIILIN